MPRAYSHTACNQCKRRKKKCDENKPGCNACNRLHLICQYNTVQSVTESGRSSEVPEAFTLSPPIQQVRLLPAIKFRGETEEAILHYAPTCLQKLYNPLSDEWCRDTKLFWQLILKDDLVRDAAIACFSVMYPVQTPQLLELNRKAYGRALQEVRRRISRPISDRADELSLQTSIPLLGMIESVGPGMPSDPLHHWKALAALIARSTISPQQWASCPRHLYLMQLEALMYHFSLLAPFSLDIYSIRRLWMDLDLYNRLQLANPHTAHRTTRSPLLAGQYEIYMAVLELTFLLRTSKTFGLNEKYLKELEGKIQYCDVCLKKDFCDVEGRRDELWLAQLEMYHLFCNALMICVSVLRPPSVLRARQLKHLVADSLDRLMASPVVMMNNAPVMWPIQIIGCAIQSQEDWDKLIQRFTELKPVVDIGNVERTERLFAKVQALRASQVDLGAQVQHSLRIQFEDFQLPIGLLLFRQENGLLS